MEFCCEIKLISDAFVLSFFCLFDDFEKCCKLSLVSLSSAGKLLFIIYFFLCVVSPSFSVTFFAFANLHLRLGWLHPFG